VRGILNLIQVKVLAVRDELASPHGFIQAEEGTLPHRGQALCCASQQKLTADDRYGSEADISCVKRDVRFTPAGSTGQCNTACSLSAGVSNPKVLRGR